MNLPNNFILPILSKRNGELTVLSSERVMGSVFFANIIIPHNKFFPTLYYEQMSDYREVHNDFLLKVYPGFPVGICVEDNI